MSNGPLRQQNSRSLEGLNEEEDLATKIPVGRLAAEGAVITASILLALAGEAWWESRTERETEREYLLGLHAELVDTRSELDSDVAAREGLRSGLTMLISATDGGAVPEADQAAAIVGLARYSRQFAPVRSVFDDLVSSGRLRLIRSEEIRSTLLTYAQALGKNELEEDGSRAFVSGRLGPYLSGEVPLDAVGVGHLVQVRPGELSFEASGSSGGRSLSMSDVERLVRDDLFRNLLIERRERLDAVLARNQEVAGLIDHLLGLLSDELSNRWGEAL